MPPLCLSQVLGSFFDKKTHLLPPISHPNDPNLLELSCALFLHEQATEIFSKPWMVGGNLTLIPVSFHPSP